MALHRNEIRITFMKNLVDSGYVFLGVYRLSKTESDSTHTTWERVQDDLFLNDLSVLKKKENRLKKQKVSLFVITVWFLIAYYR